MPNAVVSLGDATEKQTHTALPSQGEANTHSEQMHKESTGCSQYSEGNRQGDEAWCGCRASL